MRKTFLVAGLLLAIGLGQAKATVIFTTGNNSPGDEENILFGTAQTNTNLVTGTSETTGITVSFTSSQLLFQTSAGAAAIKSAATVPLSHLTNLEIFATGYGFDDFIFNLSNGSGTATITAYDLNDIAYVINPLLSLANGSNFLTLTTNGGTIIKDITISVAGGDFQVFSQPRISGVCEIVRDSCIPLVVPEPSTLALMGAGFVGLFLFKLRARRNRLFRPRQLETV
jgi:hypothetical protein